MLKQSCSKKKQDWTTVFSYVVNVVSLYSCFRDSVPSVGEILMDAPSQPNLRVSDIGNVTEKRLLPIDGYQSVPLVGLMEAMQPIKEKSLFDRLNTKVFIAMENSKCPADNLTVDESAAIHLYTMDWLPEDTCLYFILNRTLRAENRRQLITWFPYMKLILTALWKIPSSPRTVWRGIKADISGQYQQGQTYTWWNFSSCADSLNVIESEQFIGKTGIRTLFSIKCESGKSIRSHSHYKGEEETLLLPGFHFEVVGKANPAEGLHIIDIRETESEFETLAPPFGSRRPGWVLCFDEQRKGMLWSFSQTHWGKS